MCLVLRLYTSNKVNHYECKVQKVFSHAYFILKREFLDTNEFEALVSFQSTNYQPETGLRIEKLLILT